MAAVARTLLQLHDMSRDLFLFDTFEGMSEPTAQDLDYSGKQAADLLRTIAVRSGATLLSKRRKML